MATRIFYVCAEGATLNSNGNCRSADRQWESLEILEATSLTQEYLTDLVTTFNPTVMSLIVLALATGIVTGYAGGMVLGVIRKGINFRM